MTVLGFHCCKGFSLVAASKGCSVVVLCGLLIEVSSLVAEHGLQVDGLSSCSSWALEYRLSGCGTWAQLLLSMWDLPGPGIKPLSPALAGGFFTIEPPGKPRLGFLMQSDTQVTEIDCQGTLAHLPSYPGVSVIIAGFYLPNLLNLQCLTVFSN